MATYKQSLLRRFYMTITNYTMFKNIADEFPNWENLTKDELLRGCVDENASKNDRERCISAVLCKYWYMINFYYVKTPSIVDREDCMDWLIDSLLYVLRQKAWTIKSNKLFNATNGPSRALNTRIYTHRKTCLRTMHSSIRSGDMYLAPLDDANFVADENVSDVTMTDNLFVNELIEKEFKSDNFVDGIILDGIMYADVFSSLKSKPKFSKYKLVNYLKNITIDTYKYLLSKYSLDATKLLQAILLLRKKSVRELYKLTSDLLLRMKDNFTHNI